MATQVTGRKRIPNREKLSAEDDALSQIAREAEARLAAKRAARAEAREIRMKELERQQKEISDDEERMSVGSRGSLRVEERSDFLEKGSRTASTLSAATLASLGGGLSRRGSCDTSISADTEASIREMKDSLVEVEEKYRKAMVSNAQLDNEKTNLMYQVDTLRETLMELEELLCETRRECEEKTRTYEREHHAHSVLKVQFEEMKETLKQSEELLMQAQQSHGKQEDYIREISDLQETLEWKDKKIRALERQKEYSDIINDERDALRDEVFRLRDALKKHGIVLGSEVTANGEVADGVIDGHADAEPASRLIQDAHTTTMSGDSMLDRAPEQQNISKTKTEITQNLCGTTQVLEKVSEDQKMFVQGGGRKLQKTKAKQNLTVYISQKEEVKKEEIASSKIQKLDCSLADVVSSVEGSCLKEHTRSDDLESSGSLALPCGMKVWSSQKQVLQKSRETNEVDISDVSGRNNALSQHQQETEIESVLVCVQEVTLNMPVENKGIASFLDSCQEAVTLDAAPLALDETGLHYSELVVKGPGVENSMQTFFKTKVKTQRFLNCFVS